MADSFWDKPPIAIAHRGGDGAGSEKENTLAAFATAQKAGYDYGETDVILTADGQVIAVHGSKNGLDSLFKKGRPPRALLQGMTLAEVRSKISIGGETVPLLEEVLKSQPKMKFFIDPKTDEVVEPLANLLKKLKVLDRVCVNSFNYQRLQLLLDMLAPAKPAACIIIGRNARLINRNLELLKGGRLDRIQGVHLHHSLVSEEMINLAHQHGIKVLVWTCNSPLAINNALDCGADGIISDNVSLLKDILTKQS